MSLSNYTEETVLGAFFKGETFVSPDTVYVGLTTTAIDDADDLTTIDEEADANYARQTITFGDITDNDGASEVKNDAIVTFPAYDADAASPVTYGFITDAQSGTTGNILAWFEFTESKQALAGEAVTIPVGDVAINLD